MTPQNAQTLLFGGSLPRPGRLNVEIVAAGATAQQVMVKLPSGNYAWVSTQDLEVR